MPTFIKQNEGTTNCGQIAVAVITGHDYKEIVRYVGHENGTRSRDLVRALRRAGFTAPSRCIVLTKDRELPTNSIVRVRREKQTMSHWVAVSNGIVYDGNWGRPLPRKEWQKLWNDCRFTSFIPVHESTTERVYTFKTATTVKTTKGYPRVSAGPHRNKYVHRMIAAAMLGRELSKDEEVHHKNGDKLDFAFQNLFVLGTADHGWVSSKQNYFMRNKDDSSKTQWEQFMAEQAHAQEVEIAQAKAAGRTYEPPVDGSIRYKWEQRSMLCNQ